MKSLGNSTAQGAALSHDPGVTECDVRASAAGASHPVGPARAGAEGWSMPPAPGDSAYRCSSLGVHTLEDEYGHINTKLIFLVAAAAEKVS